MVKKMGKNKSELFSLIQLYLVVLGIWALYRLFFSNSVWIEEFFIKGIIFSIPFMVSPLPDKLLGSLGITRVHFFKSVYTGIALGFILGLAGQVGNILRHQMPQFSDSGLSAGNLGAFLILALITAFWEQLLFTGYFLTRLSKSISYEIGQVVITGVLFSLIHIPAFIFTQHQPLNQVFISTGLLFLLGVSCAILKIRQKNLIAPIMAHALWGVTIFLFR